MARRRRRNGATWFHDHPWMTFFLGMATLETVRVAVSGWPEYLGGKPKQLPASSSTSTPSVASLYGVR